MAEPCWWIDLGRRDFDEALALQRRLVTARQENLVPDVLLYVEHPPIYTLGRTARPEHLLADAATLRRIGAVAIETDRGGDITFHGPGQLIGYPILDLKAWKRDVHAYLRAIERLLIDALDELGIHAHREPGLTGVWHSSGKLAAIGVRVSRWVTSHGFALNVATDLDYYQHIVPCGIFGRAVSSMENVLKAPVALDPVKHAVSSSFGRVFERDIREARESDLEVLAR